MYTGFLGGEGEMQDLATVNHISIFSRIFSVKIKMESTNLYGQKDSANSATWYINSEVVIPPNGHAFEAELVIST